MNTINTNPDKQLKTVERQINLSIFIAIALIASILVAYFLNFNKGFSVSSSDWGTFGDFVGGTLNPLLAALAFYWLTSSIRLQLQELRETRNVLKDTSDHQEKIAHLEEKNVATQQDILLLQTESLKKQILASEQQQEQIAIQNFESLFFQLLNTKKNSLNDIFSYQHKDKHYGSNAIKSEITKFKTIKHDENWTYYYTQNLLDSWGSYFRICYQIVKLIDENLSLKPINDKEIFKNFDYSYNQKKYFDIFRSTFTQYELEALFFNCLSEYGAPKFKNLISKYGMFEPLLIDNYRAGETLHRLTRYGYLYKNYAFEENTAWKNYIKEINSISLTYNQEDITNRINDLYELLFIERTVISMSIEKEEFIIKPFYYQIVFEFSYLKISDIFSINCTRQIKRDPNSIHQKNIKLIKVNLALINSSKNSIQEIKSIAGDDTHMDQQFILKGNYNVPTTLNKLNNDINSAKNSIIKYKDEIKKTNTKLHNIINCPMSQDVLCLIKYGISYNELLNYNQKTNKNC